MQMDKSSILKPSSSSSSADLGLTWSFAFNLIFFCCALHSQALVQQNQWVWVQVFALESFKWGYAAAYISLAPILCRQWNKPKKLQHVYSVVIKNSLCTFSPSKTHTHRLFFSGIVTFISWKWAKCFQSRTEFWMKNISFKQILFSAIFARMHFQICVPHCYTYKPLHLFCH